MASGPITSWPIEGEKMEAVTDCIFLCPISHAKVMFKILQVGLQKCVNRKLSTVQAGFRKGKGTRNQIANICWIMEKPREFRKNIYFCFIDYAKAFDCVDHNKLWKILKEMGIPDHLTCFLQNLYAATVGTGHGTVYWFKIGKGVCQRSISKLCCHPAYLVVCRVHHSKRWAG